MRRLILLLMLINIFNTLFGQNKARIAPANATSSVPIYEFKIATIDNSQTIDFQQFKGKKLVLLNVASKCGYTPQYADWEKFYEDNKEKVVVLGFPANNFLGQEPGSNDQIADFCNTTYGVSFPMFRKVSVKGKDQHPIYRWLSDKTLNGWNDKEPSWNFCKYVINEKGELTHFFPSDVKPDDAAFLKAME